MAAQPDAEILIFENARRLTEDAEFLLADGRNASALVLAIHAVEELGKFYLARWRDITEHISKQNRQHARKQSVLGIFYGAVVSLRIVTEILSRLDFPPIFAKDPANFHRLLDVIRAEPEGEIIASQAMEGAIELVARAMAAEQRVALTHRAMIGETERLKRSALYLDVNEFGVVASDPMQISAELAREWVEHARFFLNTPSGNHDFPIAADFDPDVFASAFQGVISWLAARKARIKTSQ